MDPQSPRHRHREVTTSLDAYQYADATRSLYSFAWDEFCSFLCRDAQGPASRRRAASRSPSACWPIPSIRSSGCCIPFVPFITEEVWQQLNRSGGMSRHRAGRGEQQHHDRPLAGRGPGRINPEIEQRFALFQSTLGALREIRSRQNIPPRSRKSSSGSAATSQRRITGAAQSLLRSDGPGQCLRGSAGRSNRLGPNATVPLAGMEVIVNLQGFLDVAAERARIEKQEAGLRKQIEGKERKLENANFVERAPADVVERERESLVQLRGQLESLLVARAELEKMT
jgi:valyl-tRNA synthetase